MNIMIAAVGVDHGIFAASGTAEGALFVAIFAAVGCALCLIACRLTRRCEDVPQFARYTIPRL